MYVLGIDLGTNSVKSLILDLKNGQVIGFGQKGYGYIAGKGAEQDPDFVWNMVVQSIHEAIKDSGIDAGGIKAIGLSGQMHGTVLYDLQGKRISNIITWEDSRCDKDFLNKITEIAGEDIQKSGCGIATGFLGPTVYHIIKHSKIDICHVLLPTDWLRQKLTGDKTFLTDHSNASSSGFFDAQKRDWNYNLIEKLGLSKDIFPKAVSTISFDGSISKSISEETGLTVGTPVTVGGGDQPLSMIGSGICGSSHGILLNIGTGSQISKVGEDYHKDKETIVFCFPERGYSILGAALSGGAALKWWRKISEDCARIFGAGFYEGKIYHKMDQLASKIPPGADGLAFIPYLRGTRAKPELKAGFAGLTHNHTYAHFIRALLEGVVFELYYLYEKLGSIENDNVNIIAAGGGFSSLLWTQIAADIFGREIKITQYQEQAALGAAFIAGVAVGYYKDIKEACNNVKYSPDVVKPKKENIAKYKEIYESIYRKHL